MTCPSLPPSPGRPGKEPAQAPPFPTRALHALRAGWQRAVLPVGSLARHVHALQAGGELAKLRPEHTALILRALDQAGVLGPSALPAEAIFAGVAPEQLGDLVRAMHLSGRLAQVTRQQLDYVLHALQEAAHKRARFLEEASAPSRELPTVFHITHPKAGSQWIYRILQECYPDRIATNAHDEGARVVLERPEPGRIYPTLYISKDQFEAMTLPPNWRLFVVIRDARDVLVSLYFSLLRSHRLTHDQVRTWRSRLQDMTKDEDLGCLIEEWLPRCEAIQRSWVQSDHPLLRYEDLLHRDLELLVKTLLFDCELPVGVERFREIVVGARFERLTHGRSRGQVDPTAHERKGIAGDWRNHFSDGVVRRFKERYGSLLIETGYEKDDNW